MDYGTAAQKNVITNFYVTREQNIIGDYIAVAHGHIVRQVSADHQVVAITDPRHASVKVLR